MVGITRRKVFFFCLLGTALGEPYQAYKCTSRTVPSPPIVLSVPYQAHHPYQAYSAWFLGRYEAAILDLNKRETDEFFPCGWIEVEVTHGQTKSCFFWDFIPSYTVFAPETPAHLSRFSMFRIEHPIYRVAGFDASPFVKLYIFQTRESQINNVRTTFQPKSDLHAHRGKSTNLITLPLQG